MTGVTRGDRTEGEEGKGDKGERGERGEEGGKEGGEEILAHGWAGQSKVVPEGPRGLKNERHYKHRQK